MITSVLQLLAAGPSPILEPIVVDQAVAFGKARARQAEIEVIPSSDVLKDF